MVLQRIPRLWSGAGLLMRRAEEDGQAGRAACPESSRRVRPDLRTDVICRGGGTCMLKYKTVFQGGCGRYVEKKSKFIAHVKDVESVEEAQEYIEAVKKRFWDARHNCFAFRVGTEQVITRCSDDGEPAGTAGRPILDVILSNDIYNIVIVVTRYFGGTLLGTGGLIRSYTQAAKDGIEDSDIIEKIPGIRYRADMDYTDLGKARYLLEKNRYVIEDTEYTDKVLLHVLVPAEEKKAFEKTLADGCNGRISLKEQEEVYYGVIDQEVIVF